MKGGDGRGTAEGSRGARCAVDILGVRDDDRRSERVEDGLQVVRID